MPDILLFLLAPLFAIGLVLYVVQTYQVEGQSMEPTLQNADRLIVNKLPRSISRLTDNPYIPKRGDVIIFNQSGIGFGSASEKQLIKRVIGLPGERVLVSEGKVTVFNKDHPNGFEPDKEASYKLSANASPGNSDITLKDDEVFVCGDNRTNSQDSRNFGPVSAEKIVGKLSLRIFPFHKADSF